ncbi:MAG: hypothetical protein ABSB69_20640 [Solirubrobacteraceae bacterium]
MVLPPPGPYSEVPIDAEHSAPFYILRFDKRGRPEGPATLKHLMDALVARRFTDVYVFSHGWNNEWKTALDRYENFMRRFHDLRERYRLGFDRPYRPLLAGIIWPSAALTAPWSDGPEFAGAEDAQETAGANVSRLASLVEQLTPTDEDRFRALAEKTRVDQAEARELIQLAQGSLVGADPDLDGDTPRDTDDVLVSWAQLERATSADELPASPTEFGTASRSAEISPEAALSVGQLNPRNLFRVLTVWAMKDRAGVVGTLGVGPALKEMLESSKDAETRFHLIGHSFGARLLMAAIGRSTTGKLPRAVNSLLLLQPAVNYLCFSASLPHGGCGGFRTVLDSVRQPVLSTFSRHDVPLTKTFHLALHRRKDIGEVEIAAAGPPSQYAALGGFGPGGEVDFREVAIKDPTDCYELGDAAPRIWAVNGDRAISGHGDIVSDSTAWALFNLARA